MVVFHFKSVWHIIYAEYFVGKALKVFLTAKHVKLICSTGFAVYFFTTRKLAQRPGVRRDLQDSLK
jgi:hypothetical protein